MIRWSKINNPNEWDVGHSIKFPFNMERLLRWMLEISARVRDLLG